MATALRRLDLLAALGALMVLLGIVGVTLHTLGHDRAALYERDAQERRQSLDEAARRVEEGLQDVVDDLAFGTQVVQGTHVQAEQVAVLSALVGSVRAYRGAVLCAAAGQPLLVIADPRRQGPAPEVLGSLVSQVAQAALAPGAALVEASPPVEGPDASRAGEGWLRVFATRVPAGEGAPQDRSLALVVDTQSLLAPLGILAAEDATSVLALGPHGRVVPVSSPRVAGSVAAARQGHAPTLQAMIDGMEAGQAGSARIPQAELEAAGLGRVEAQAVWRPVAVAGVEPWAVASISSMSALQDHERLLLARVGGAGLALGLLVVVLGGYVLSSSRRSVVLAERLRHADALVAMRERAARTLAHIPSAVLVLDAQDRALECNPSFTEHFGAAWPGTALAAAFPQADPVAVARLHAVLAQARASGGPAHLPDEHLHLGATPGRYRLHAVPLLPSPSEPQARPPDHVLVIDDLTELIALRTRLIRNEKLATVGVLAAGIAHEIGTPLGVIRGRAEYIQAKLGPQHPQHAGLAVIVEQIERVVRTIRALLDFAREGGGEPGQTGLAPGSAGEEALGAEAADAEVVVARVEALLHVEAERRGVDLVCAVPSPSPLLAVDADQLELVLVNLVVNALDAVSAGGQVRLSVSPAAEGLVRLVVEDDGVGIPAADLHRVFDPFYTTKKRGQGTGLGLALVLQVAQAHGAQVELESEPGRGTRAILSWPAGRQSGGARGARTGGR